MKKLFAPIGATLAQIAFAAPVFAQTTVPICPEGAFNVLCRIRFENALPAVFTLLLVVAVIIALFFLIWGGIKWVLSGGDKTAVEGARNTIIAAVVGLVIVFLAWFILNIVGQVFFGRPLIELLQIPRLQITSP